MEIVLIRVFFHHSDAYEVKANKDTFKYQAKVKWLISQFQRLISKVSKAVLTNPFLDFFNILLEFALFPKNVFWSVCIH